VEATLKSPLKSAPKKAVPQAEPVPDWKLWKRTFLDGGTQTKSRWGDVYTLSSQKVSLDVLPNYTICACCGAPWILPGGKVRSYLHPLWGREEPVPFTAEQVYFSEEIWRDRQGIYFGEFQDVATLRKDMGMEDEDVFKSFEIHDGEAVHALVWKEVV
jgi:hypothetical protein